MPLTKKGSLILEAMQTEYGTKKGESVFYASKNKGTIKGVEPTSTSLKPKRVRRGKRRGQLSV